MERDPEQKMDDDLYRAVLDDNYARRLDYFLAHATHDQLVQVNQEISNIAEGLVNNVNNNELNFPEEPTAPNYGKRFLIFVAASAAIILIFRYGPDFWNFIRRLVGEIVQSVDVAITPENIRSNLARLLSNPATRDSALRLIGNLVNTTDPA